MRFMHLGDIVGKPARDLIRQRLKTVRQELNLEFVTANAENSAAGSGINHAIYNELINAGIDCITMGDHTFKRKEAIAVLESCPRIIRPGNYPAEAPGKGFVVFEIGMGARAAVVNLQGRVFMQPIDCPFHAADRILRQLPKDVKVILVDFHAEATSDMQIMGRYLDGRVTAVLGTHTHVVTADEQIYPGGTAFQCDVGMCGAMKSIIGRKIECVTEATLTGRPVAYDVADEDVRLHGTIVDFNPLTGRAEAVERWACS